MSDFLPPQAPDANEPRRWEARPQDGDDHARMVVAAKPGAAPVLQAGEHPPRNGQALWALGIGLAGIALLVVSVGISFVVSLPCAIIAIVQGRQGGRRAAAESIGGARAARAGVILGVVGIVLCVVACVAWILIFVLDPDITTDFGRDSPTAPTDLSTIAAVVLRGHL